MKSERAEEKVSTSATKLQSSRNKNDIHVNDASTYRIINFLIIFNVISAVVVCKTCKSEVTFSEASVDWVLN